MILLHTFKNAFGASEIDTPIEDPKSGGRFVERIRGSMYESSIGVIKNTGTPLVNLQWGLENGQDPSSDHAVWEYSNNQPSMLN